MINKPRVALYSVVLITTLLTSSTLFADGFRNTPEGARAVGAFGGHRAFADDANATIHNSANLVDLEQPMVQINTTLGYGRNDFTGAGGTDETKAPFFALPGFSAAAPLKDGKYAVGLAFYVPYGRSVEWPANGYFATNGFSYAGSMMVADLTPNVAMRINDSLSVAVGADFYYGTVKQWTYPAAYGGLLRSKLSATGQTIGWNAALTWKITDKQRIAATYRSPFTIKYKGDNTYSGLLSAQNDADAKIEYPTVVALAYGIELTDTLRIEVDSEWLDFSQYETLTINEGGSATPYPQRLKETWTAGFGLEWDFKPQWTLRTGYKYLKNPTPDDTYTPLSPDEDQGVISLGLGYETEHHTFDIGYAVGLFDGRDIPATNPSTGTYDYTVHLLSLSYGYKF